MGVFFFPLVLFCVGGLTWFLAHYKELAKYFMEDRKDTSLKAILLESLEKSVFPLILGAVHALFLDSLFVQTIVLFTVEACYFAVKLLVLRSGVNEYRFKVAMLSVTSLLRLVLIVTLYLY